ncbi:MAG: 50S ribosomal protein L18 [Bacteroidales bacterium]
MALTKIDRRLRIKRRVRKIVSGTADRPRLSVFRSNKHISVQLIDDKAGVTLCSVSSLSKEFKDNKGITNCEMAAKVGESIAQKAKEAKIEAVVFDRNGYLYHGRIQSLAEAARKGGLKF